MTNGISHNLGQSRNLSAHPASGLGSIGWELICFFAGRGTHILLNHLYFINVVLFRQVLYHLSHVCSPSLVLKQPQRRETGVSTPKATRWGCFSVIVEATRQHPTKQAFQNAEALELHGGKTGCHRFSTIPVRAGSLWACVLRGEGDDVFTDNHLGCNFPPTYLPLPSLPFLSPFCSVPSPSWPYYKSCVFLLFLILVLCVTFFFFLQRPPSLSDTCTSMYTPRPHTHCPSVDCCFFCLNRRQVLYSCVCKLSHIFCSS
jgi:hypothetical protein